MSDKKQKALWDIRCIYCGRFISRKDFQDKKVGRHYIPDTEFSIEELTFWHKACEAVEAIKYTPERKEK